MCHFLFLLRLRKIWLPLLIFRNTEWHFQCFKDERAVGLCLGWAFGFKGWSDRWGGGSRRFYRCRLLLSHLILCHWRTRKDASIPSSAIGPIWLFVSPAVINLSRDHGRLCSWISGLSRFSIQGFKKNNTMDCRTIYCTVVDTNHPGNGGQPLPWSRGVVMQLVAQERDLSLLVKSAIKRVSLLCGLSVYLIKASSTWIISE